jgi:hypothetical protein
MTKRIRRKHLERLTLRFSALQVRSVYFWLDFLFLVISVIIKGAIVSRHAPNKVFKKITRVHSTNMNPEPPANVLVFP